MTEPASRGVIEEAQASLEPLSGRTIAVIGYGVQGPAQALNMKDNGFDVIVGQAREFKADWRHLVDKMRISRDPDDAAYQCHGGKPVVGIWGVGFDGPRKDAAGIGVEYGRPGGQGLCISHTSCRSRLKYG